MRRLLRGLLVTATLAAVAPAAAPATNRPNGQPVGHVACTYARIGGRSKCIARGQYCQRRYARQYLRYELSCTKLDAHGRYHLQ